MRTNLYRRHDTIKRALETSNICGDTSAWYALGMAWMALVVGTRDQFNLTALRVIEHIKSARIEQRQKMGVEQ